VNGLVAWGLDTAAKVLVRLDTPVLARKVGSSPVALKSGEVGRGWDKPSHRIRSAKLHVE